MAPPEWQDRSILWNAVEENEKTKDSRLAREFVVALPVELDRKQCQQLLTEFIQSQFVADGMCADVAIHDTDGRNPHAHIMLTVRPLDEQGKWQCKTEKEYLCIRNGEEQGFTATEFKTAQDEGWEKQYQYKVGKKKMYMPPSAAEAQGLERASKYPKSTKYGRQNPISERWNSEEQLVLWRKAWADVVNLALEQAGREERIDHRSHAERGLDEQPTIHEGVAARAMERQGILSDRCELNRQIKSDNALLRRLKAEIQKLAQTVRNTIPAIAEAMETVRQNVMIFCYQLGHIRIGKRNLKGYISDVNAEIRLYNRLVVQIRDKSRERKSLLAEQKALPFWNMPKKKELTVRIAELTELLEELRSEKAVVLQRLQCADDSSISSVKKELAKSEAGLKKLEEQEQKYSAELKNALRQYAELQEQSAEFEPLELHQARLTLRPNKEQSVIRRLQNIYGNSYDPTTLFDAKRETVNLLGEEAESRALHERLRQKEQPKKNRDWER